MRGKIALEEHVSTPENNRLWDSSGSRRCAGGRFTESFYSGTFQKNLTVDRRTDLNQYGHILCQ